MSHAITTCTGQSCQNAAWGGCPCECHDAPDDTGHDDQSDGGDDCEAAE